MYPLLCFAPEVLHIRPWPGDVVDKLGVDPRSAYVEDFWLGLLGPSTVWLLRRFAAGFDYCPDGFDLDLAETARSIGLSDRSSRHSPFLRAVNRTVQFGLARLTGPDQLAVRRRIPPLSSRQVSRLSPALQARHSAWQAQQGTVPAPAVPALPKMPPAVPAVPAVPATVQAEPTDERADEPAGLPAGDPPEPGRLAAISAGTE